MKVFRAVVEIAVMLEATSVKHAQVVLEDMDLMDLVREMDDGSFLGQSRVARVREVPPKDVTTEEQALGGDGSFFADLGEV